MLWLHNSRIIAIFAVVILHVSVGIVVSNPVGSESWWIGNIFDSVTRWCVPVFIMISGALLLDQSKKEDLKSFYSKRLSKILIPVVFWSAFFLLWNSLRGLLKGQPLDITDLLTRVLSGKPHYHMWFLYMIVFLYLFTPFFRKITQNSSRSEVLVLVVASFFISALNYLGEHGVAVSELFPNWFLGYVPYFFLGYLIRFSAAEYSKALLWGAFSLSVFLTALGCYVLARSGGLDAGMYFYSYLSLTVIPMSISAMYLLKQWQKPIGSARLAEKLSALTLGIYLIHPFFLEIIIHGWHGYRTLSPVISIPLVSLIVFAASLCSVFVIDKIPYLRRVI